MAEQFLPEEEEENPNFVDKIDRVSDINTTRLDRVLDEANTGAESPEQLAARRKKLRAEKKRIAEEKARVAALRQEKIGAGSDFSDSTNREMLQVEDRLAEVNQELRRQDLTPAERKMLFDVKDEEVANLKRLRGQQR